MATGVASPKAHGQLMTRTEIPRAKAKAMVSPERSQPMVVMIAIVITQVQYAGYLIGDLRDGRFCCRRIANHFYDLGECGILSTLDASQRIKPD